MIDNENQILPSPKPTHSAHSSNTTFLPHQNPTTIEPLDNMYSMDEDVENEEDEGDEDEIDNERDFLKETCRPSSFLEPYKDKNAMVPVIEANELLQLDMSDDMRFRSPNDGSSNFDDYRFDLLATSHDDSCRDESTYRWSDNLEMQNLSTVQLQTSEELAKEDTYYSSTVSTILNNQLTRYPNSATKHNSLYTTQSSFATWTPNHPNYHHLPTKKSSCSQKVLKYIIFSVPFLYSNLKSTGILRKTVSHEELSANHVLAERRRREKLNEKFIILRSLVPLVTKMDKASILGDTIEYVKQLCKKIHDLEARGCQDGLKRKIRVVDGGGSGGGKAATPVQVEVSIIENDALVEMQCKHREGLLLDVMKKLRQLGVEITTVQSCVDGGMCTVEMRAKVKVNNNRQKISIIQVKKAINQIISPSY